MKKILILVLAAAVFISLGFFFKSYESGAAFTWRLSDNGNFLFPLILISAIVDSINPCAFSVLILTIAFLASVEKFRTKIFRIGGFYILGIFIVYLMIGLGLLQVLHLFNTPHFMAKFGAILLIFLGAINILSELFSGFPLKLKIPSAVYPKMAGLMEKGSIPSAFGLGALVGVCEFPCTGGPYLTALGLLRDNSTLFKGIFYLMLYNLIFILPLVIILLLASNETAIQKFENMHNKRKRFMRFAEGAAMILLGIIIFYF